MKNVHPTGIRFETKKDFKISDWLTKEADVSPAENKLYFFELLFPKELAAETIEKIFYPGQTIRVNEDGTVLVGFRSTELFEVSRRVIGQGRNVKVLQPPELVRKIKNEIERLKKLYDI